MAFFQATGCTRPRSLRYNYLMFADWSFVHTFVFRLPVKPMGNFWTSGEIWFFNEIGCHCDPKRHLLRWSMTRQKRTTRSRCERDGEDKNKNKKGNTKASPYWGDEALRAIAMKFVLSPYLTDFIKFEKKSKFDRSGVFSQWIPEICPLPLSASIPPMQHCLALTR